MSDTSQKIREWTLHEVVGRGGMGVVYRATHDLEPGRDFAIKVVAPHLVADENVRARFLREIQTARELKHPNIVEAETAFEEDGQLYLPMAFLDGVTLDRVLAERDGVPMPEHEALAIFRQAAAGLAHAHERGFLHRDIKPANIHVDRDGRVRLLDFGLARRGEGTHLTRAGGVVGTVAYMAPEYLEHQVMSPAGDVFALGLVGIELATGKSPLPERAPDVPITVYLGVVMREFERGLPKTQELVSGLSPPLRWVLERALSVDLEGRFPHAAALLESLDQSEPTVPSRPPPPEAGRTTPGLSADAPRPPGASPASPSGWTRSGAVGLALALAMGLLALGGWWLTGAAAQRDAPRSEPIVEERPSAPRAEAETMDGGFAEDLGASHPPALIGPPEGMLRVDGGPVELGCRKACRATDPPRRTVELPTFYIDRTEVSVKSYAECVEAGGCTKRGRGPGCFAPSPATARRPANCVSQTQAAAYCAFRGGHLPSEPEWEKAAQGADGADYPWGPGRTRCRARLKGCGPGPVDVDDTSYPPSSSGALHLAGNVWEWTASEEPSGRSGALRGGSYVDGLAMARVWFRKVLTGSTRSPWIGFRCAR